MLSLINRNTKTAPITQEPEEIKEIALFSGLDEMWQYNWKKFNQTNKLKWLIKNDEDREQYEGFKSVFEAEEFLPFDRLDNQFLILMDDWFELTKAKSSREELYTLMRKVIKARNRYMMGDKFQSNLIRKFDKMISDLTTSNLSWDPDREIMALSIQTKFLIDEKQITVVKYQKLVDLITEMNQTKTKDNGENV